MENVVSEYRALLEADESLAALEKAIALARRIFTRGVKPRRKGGSHLSGLTQRALSPRPSGSASQNARRVDDVAHILSAMPDIARQYGIGDDQYSLLIDTLLVLFHHAYFVLLPKAQNDRGLLLRAFASFAERLPNLADRFQVEGLVALESGKPEAASDCFRAALAFTPSEQHDFLTRLQMLWSHLMERGEFSLAFACLQDVEARVTRIDFEEFQGLMAVTFAEARRHSNKAG